MSKRVSKEISLIALALLIFTAVKFFDIHIKQFEEVHPFEMVETGVVHNELIENKELVQENSFDGTEDDIIRLTNEFRKEKGLDILIRNESLMESAKLKAEDMKSQEYFAHVSPDGVELWNLVQQVGYSYSVIAENIAEGYFSAESVVDAWMDSEGHRKNILSVELEEIGVSVLEIKNKEERKSYVLVQHFAAPQKELDRKQSIEVVCDQKVKKNCKKIEKKKEEYRELVKEQDKIIDKAEKEGFSKKDLIDLYDNLKDLKEIRDQYKEFSDGCETYINKCDRWE
ncbi:hypothetical protein HN784_04115 [bacterium]|jgi:uncharacterized protein YkwD|nr:hypothetical protein [bacterium]MBT4251177.1 hypothetical protein [bacterium]MBT4598031.1 hypothetical protein [bacterium]MBT6753557.1 hypothetical protein [bacterium]MBT7037672.1 hypothetical protein [bacterium]